jgi:hypothetical protein
MHDKNLCSPSPFYGLEKFIGILQFSFAFQTVNTVFNRYGHMWPHFRLLLVETLAKLVNQQLLRMKGLPATG